MAKGAVAKEKVFEKILEVFDGSFMYNGGKEARIPMEEDGVLLQIKVALTCAKDVVSPEGEVMKAAAAVSEGPAFEDFPKREAVAVEPTEEEKQNMEDLLKALGL